MPNVRLSLCTCATLVERLGSERIHLHTWYRQVGMLRALTVMSNPVCHFHPFLTLGSLHHGTENSFLEKTSCCLRPATYSEARRLERLLSSSRPTLPRSILNTFHSIPFLHITSFSEYQSESTSYRDSTSLQCTRICNSMQTKSDVNGISLEEIRRKTSLVQWTSENTISSFFPAHKQNETPPKKSLPLTAPLSLSL